MGNASRVRVLLLTGLVLGGATDARGSVHSRIRLRLGGGSKGGPTRSKTRVRLACALGLNGGPSRARAGSFLLSPNGYGFRGRFFPKLDLLDNRPHLYQENLEHSFSGGARVV